MCIYRHHPLIEGMLMLLPEEPDALTEPELARWLAGFEANLRLLYQVTPRPFQVDADAAQQPHPFEDGAGDLCARYCCARLRTHPLHTPPHVLVADAARQATAALEDLQAARLRSVVADPAATPEDVVAAAADAGHPVYITGDGAADLERFRADALTDAERDPFARHASSNELAAQAAALEAERYDVDRLEAEARQPGPPPYVAPSEPPATPTPLDLVRGLLHEGGSRGRDGRFARRLICPFVIEPDPSLAVAEAAHPCGHACSGEVGLNAHLSMGHGLKGHDNDDRRRQLVAEAVTAAEAVLVAELDPTLTQIVEAGQPVPEPLSWAPPVEPSPLDRDALTGLMGPTNGVHAAPAATTVAVIPRADAAAELVSEPWAGPTVAADVIQCPYPFTAGVGRGQVCGVPMADAIVLDRHLQRDHGLNLVVDARRRVNLVDRALEELDARLDAAAAQ